MRGEVRTGEILRTSSQVTVLLSVLLIGSTIVFAGVLYFENADVIYPEGYLEHAVLVGNIFESVRSRVIDLIGNDPGRITIILQEKGAVSNGYTNPVFHRTIVLYTWPPEAWIHFQLPVEDWYTYLIIHEFTHMVHLTYRDIWSEIISVLTGLPYLPQLSTPFLEGTTLFAESAFSKASGRLNNPFYSDALYYFSLPNFPSFQYKELSPADDYRGGLLYYNITGGFYKYLVETYGLDAMKRYLEYTSTALPFIEAITGQRSEDPFEFAFGKPFDELYADWILSLSQLNYLHGKLVYKAYNTDIRKILSSGNSIIVSESEYGPVTSYIGFVSNRLVNLDDGELKVRNVTAVNALDFQVDGGRTYVLRKIYRNGMFLNQLWELRDGRLILEGNVSAFAVRNGEIFTAKFDTAKMTGVVEERRRGVLYENKGYIRHMVAGDDFLALLTLDNKIVVLTLDGREILRIDDRNLKGPYLKVWKDGILFSRVEGKYVTPYYLDVKSRKIYRLGEKTIMSDFTVHKDELYYVSYVPYGTTGGMGIYKFPISMVEIETLSGEVPMPDIKVRSVKYEVGNEFTFRISKFLTPVTWAPFYTAEATGSRVTHTLYAIFTFANLEADTFLVLTPIFDILQPDVNRLSFQFGGYRQFFAFLTLKDTFGVSGSYLFPSNDYSLRLRFEIGSFTPTVNTSLYLVGTASFKSSENYALDTVFSLVGVIPTVEIAKNTVAFGLGLRANVLAFPFGLELLGALSNESLDRFLSPESVYLATNAGIALSPGLSVIGNVALKLTEPSNTYFDVSAAFTTFRDSASLFGGQLFVRNSGITVGLANPVLERGGLPVPSVYGHFFVESYLQMIKLYPSLGLIFPLQEGAPGLFYVGLSNTPHGLPVPLFTGQLNQN